MTNLDVEQYILEVVERGFASGRLQPGGSSELEGFDPNYDTRALYLPHDVDADSQSTDGESNSPINAGETRQFEFIVHNKLESDSSHAYGVVVRVPPGTIGGSYLIDGPGPRISESGGMRSVACTVDDFNQSRGRFFQGVIHVRGTIENGPNTGLIQIAYGEPQSQEELGSSSAFTAAGSVVTEDPKVLTGSGTLNIPTAGVYIVTVNADLTIVNGGGTVILELNPSLGPSDFRLITALPVEE